MEGLDKQKVLAIGGPTASGKTALSVQLAHRLNGEIICADSMQIYQELDVGTAKVTQQEMEGVPHHLVGFLSPECSFSVAEFVQRAHTCIQEIASKGRLPILVGGTGLYIQSLLYGVQFSQESFDPAVRTRLQRQAEEMGAEAMYRKLCQIDPAYAQTVHPNNVHRVLRALELFEGSGITMTQQRKNSLPAERPYDSVLLCCTYTDREVLYERINQRVDWMMEQGLLMEAQQVYNHQHTWTTAAQAIGYKEFFPYFTNDKSLDACVEQLKQASRNYAKRQLTWFRRMPETIWLEGGPGLMDQAQQHIKEKWADLLQGGVYGEI